MKIRVAKNIGFCSGVNRAINLVENELKKGNKVYILGELLHNKQEMDRLQRLGVEVVEDVSIINTNFRCSLVIRTHGVARSVYEELLRLNNINIIDGTCPIVKRNQEITKEWTNKGYNVIIYGDPQHPEITALISYVSPSVKSYIITCKEDVEKLDILENDKVLVISQTTKQVDEYKKICDLLTTKYKNIKVFNTICKETINREKEVVEIAKTVDLLIVVGGKHSANTNKLMTISKNYNNNVIIVSSEDEIENDFFNYRHIGIISGTSTPMWQVKKIIEKFSTVECKT
ncbi:MAG: 4-hydroxy-3-methylbut-2-enyl diphosphate reductase [Endomicrobia bacterium]|nr:4-hydroxy-3-methylbut-2-enyl diphosphate reductase [Endomicrobiia bacterium]